MPVTSADASPTRTPRRAYLVLSAAVALQACLGATYAWSVFVGFLRMATPMSQKELQTPFTVFYIVFPLTTIVAGRVLERAGPRRCALFGGVLFASGWLVAGLGAHHFGWTILGIGVLGGVGVGFAYLVPIAAGMRWFPHRRGLVTGVAVAGFGGGAALVSQAAQYLMGIGGFSPFLTMATFGGGFLLVTVPAAAVLTYPPGVVPAPGTASAPTGLMRQRDFQLLYLAMFAGLAAGFTINANLAQLSPALRDSAKLGALAVTLFAVANALGRVIWGAIADRCRPAGPIRANLLIQAAMLALHPWLLGSAGGLLALAAVSGFNYGGVLVLYAASAGRIWGTAQVGRVYGALFSANCLAAIAPLAAAHVFDRMGQFTMPLFVLSGVLVLATLCVRQRTPMQYTGSA